MRSITVLLLVGVAAVAALPLDDAAPRTKEDILNQLLQAKPEDNDIIPEKEKDTPSSPSPAPSSPSPAPLAPSPTASPSAGQVSTPSGAQVNEEEEEEKPKDSDAPEEGEQEINEDPSLQVDAEEEEPVPVVVIEPLPQEPEVERVFSGYNVAYAVAEGDSPPMISGEVDGPLAPEDEEEEEDNFPSMPQRERTALVDELHWPEEVSIMELPEGQVDSIMTLIGPDDVEPLESGLEPGMGPVMDPEMEPEMGPGMEPGMGPVMEPEMEPEMGPGMEPEIGPGMEPGMGPVMVPGMRPGMEPLPLDYEDEAQVDPGFLDFRPDTESQDDDFGYEDYYDAPQEEVPLPEDDVPVGLFSWLLPGFIDDRISSDNENDGEELPVIVVPVEQEVEAEAEEGDEEEEEQEEDFFPVAAPVEEEREPGIIVFEENIPMGEENGEEEEENYEEENGAEEEDNGPYEDDNEEEENEEEEELEGRADLPMDVRGVYFIPGEDQMPEERVFEDTMPEVDYVFPEEEEGEEVMPVEMPDEAPEMMPPQGAVLLREDEMPMKQFNPIIFPDFSEDEGNERQEPFYMPEEEYSYDTDDSPVLIVPPEEYSYDTNDSPFIEDLRDDYSYDTDDSPFIAEPREDYSYDTGDSPIIVVTPEEYYDTGDFPRIVGQDFSKPISSHNDPIPLREILFPIMKMVAGDMEEGDKMLGREDVDTDANGDKVEVIMMSSPPDTEPSLLPIAQVKPDSRPLPIAAYPNHEHMNQEPQWSPNHNTNTPNSSPHTISIFFDQWSDNGPYSSFREQHDWPQRQGPFRNNVNGYVGSDVHYQPHFGIPNPPTRYEKTFDSTPPRGNVHGFGGFRPKYSEDFGYSHSHGPATQASPFFRPHSSPSHYHRQDGFSQHQPLFPQSHRVTHSEYNVFQSPSGSKYRPEQDIYPSGSHAHPDPFYQASELNHRTAPFTSFRRPQPQVDIEILPLDMAIYPDVPFSSPRQQFPLFVYPRDPSFTPSSHHNDMGFQHPRQGFTGSGLYPDFPPPYARYAPGYP